MGVITLMFLVLAMPVATFCSTDQWLHHIYVDNQTGVSDRSCWESGYSTPCLSLNLALTGAQHYNHSTSILLQPGQHQLYDGSATQLRNMSQLAIVGNGSEGEVVINCKPLAGLAFVWSEGIVINNIDLFGCGALQSSTSTNISAHSATFLEIRVALFFSDCRTVTLTQVRVIESPGTGVVMYNPLGVVNIDKSQFLHNGFSCGKEVMHGGGGLVIDANEVTSELSCTIMSSTFSHNTASSGQFVYLSQTTSHNGYFGLGRGGGISVVFRGGAVNNVVQLNNASFDSNAARFGGGLFLGFFGNASNNKVHMNNCWLQQNEASLDSNILLTDSTKGGGVFISLVASASGSFSNNAVAISETNFLLNEAQTGGGIAVTVLHKSYKYVDTSNKLFIDNCNFINNTAFQGSSAYFSQNNNAGPVILNTTVCCSNFSGGQCGALVNGYGLPCYGNVLLQSFLIFLESKVTFNNNHLSALSLHFSTVELLPSTQIEFKDNNAVNGAAIYVVDCSSIIVNDDVKLFFQRNSVSNLGGAIYAESCHSSSLIGVDSCFFRHTNSTLHPNDWGIIVNFSNNSNSIYVDSINFCLWPEPSLDTHDHTHQTFCWTGWNYAGSFGDDDCRNQLTSGPAYVNNTGQTHYTIFPGGCLSLKNYLVYDSWGNDITSQINMNFEVDVVSGAGSVYMAGLCFFEQFQVLPDYGQDYVNKSILLSVHPSQFPGVLVNVSFKLCENGSIYSYDEGCIHICNTTSTSTPVCTASPFCSTSTCYDDVSTCNVYTGALVEMCGSCDPGDAYGVAFNFPFFICTKCEWYGIILVLLELVLVLLVMIILSVLHINITSGHMNGFILYSQLVSLDLPGMGSTAWVPSSINTTYYMNTKQFASVPLTFYSIWNLNFLTLVPTPFSIPNTSAAGVILLQYIKATCPLVFILVTYVWIRWYNNGYRFVIYTTRPVHQLLARFWQKFKIQPSLIDTYAGLILLSYVLFLAVSVKTFTAFAYHSFDNTATDVFLTALVALGIVSLLTFVFPLMSILLFYHLKVFQHFLIWCKLDKPGLHALVDAYQGCFKNSATDGSERRYFAGLYLSFRFCYLSAVCSISWILLRHHVIIILLIPLQVCMSFLMTGMVAILRPYKRTAHNVLDFLIFCFMIVSPLLSVLDLDLLSSLYVHIYIGADYLPFRNIIFLPFLGFLLIFFYRLLKFCCFSVNCKRKAALRLPSNNSNPSSLPERTPLVTHPTTTVVALDDDYVQDDLYADRILNPSGYKEQHNRYPSIQASTADES